MYITASSMVRLLPIGRAGRDNIDVLFDDLSPLPVHADPFQHDVERHVL